MANVEELLKNSLDKLEVAGLNEFLWCLSNDQGDNSKAKMENADRLKMVEKMVSCFGPKGAVKITVDILRKIKQNDWADQLEKTLKQAVNGGSRINVEELLKNSLDDLLISELKEFLWCLAKNYKCISKDEMENADSMDTVDKMVSCFGSERAVTITVNTLRKMSQNQLAEELEIAQKQAVNSRSRLNDEELLEYALDELRESELKEFLWCLMKNRRDISNAEMRNADRRKTVEKMVSCFGPERAVMITVDTLRKIYRNELADELQIAQKQGNV
nr:uncharacterized protein LOC100536116 [Danio rerio]|eukprot:XP_021331012.1 uncharacterized protein LOC100536116 [Danio rerio]